MLPKPTAHPRVARITPSLLPKVALLFVVICFFDLCEVCDFAILDMNHTIGVGC